MHITASFASTENCLVFGTSDVLSSWQPIVMSTSGLIMADSKIFYKSNDQAKPGSLPPWVVFLHDQLQ